MDDENAERLIIIVLGSIFIIAIVMIAVRLYADWKVTYDACVAAQNATIKGVC